MVLAELLGAIEPLSIEGSPQLDIEGIESDSRRVRDRFLFVAIPGRHHDGKSFIHEATEKGAVAIVTESPDFRLQGVVLIQVHDARAALACLAAKYFNYPADDMSLLGVTGTNGKTTTTHLMAQVFDGVGKKAGLIGTIDYRVGRRSIAATRTTPEPVDLHRLFAEMRDTGCDSVVMEVSSHAIEQKRVGGLSFEVAAFTNLSRDHLDYHGTMEAYFETKAGFIRHVAEDPGASIALNSDDSWIQRLSAECTAAANCLRYGTSTDADVMAEQIESDMDGTRCRVRTPWGSDELRIRLPGSFNLSNSLAALTCCVFTGIELGNVLAQLGKAVPVPGRIEEITTDRDFRVFVDYAHTDDALTNVLRTLKQLKHNKVILIFGCGGDRDPSKRPAMGRVASELVDYAIITSDNPRTEDPGTILDQVRAGFDADDACSLVEDRREAIAHGLAMAESGDIVLIAGKGHENFQDFGTRVVPFDDRAVARELLESV